MKGLRFQSWLALSLAGMALAGTTACNNAKYKHSQPVTEFAEVDLDNGGTVSGTIHFAGKAPARVPIDMAQDPACAMSGPNMTEQYVVNNDRLANVFVSVKDGLGDKVYAPSHVPVIIDQRGCRFVPHVASAMAGQDVEFMNSDGTMHNVHMESSGSSDEPVDISQGPHAGPDHRQFHTPVLMMPLRCNNHPWMEAFLNVSANPFFAVSDGDGNFVIHGLPPGTYTLMADHEKLGQQTMTVTVAAKGTAKADFTYRMK